MADRGVSADVIAEVQKAANQPIHLFEAILDAGTVYLTDAAFNIVWGGHTYLANGQFLGYEGLSEESELEVASITLMFSGVDQTMIAAFDQEDIVDREVRIYRAFLSVVNDTVVADPYVRFAGRLDEMSIDEDPTTGKSEVRVTAASQFIDFQRRPGRHTNPSEQAIFFPGDNGFKFCSEVARPAIWGRVPV